MKSGFRIKARCFLLIHAKLITYVIIHYVTICLPFRIFSVGNPSMPAPRTAALIAKTQFQPMVFEITTQNHTRFTTTLRREIGGRHSLPFAHSEKALFTISNHLDRRLGSLTETEILLIAES